MIPTQRIVKERRQYNQWVATETLEDYALRFTAGRARKSSFRVGNTALGPIAFLACEAIGASITVAYGFQNAVWAIAAFTLLMFLIGLPIAYYASRYGVDIDLLTRGAGFGYLGSTLTSLVYASFTFIFFALEAAILALALEMATGWLLSLCYLVASLGVVPLVMHGITLISRLQLWSQPLWIVLFVLPYVAVLVQDPGKFAEFASLTGSEADRGEFRALFLQHREVLVEAFQRYKPLAGAYSPLAFFFNFSHNVLKGMVVDALLRGRPWPLTFDDMLTALARDEAEATLKHELAATLMGYARAHPDTIRGRPMPVIVFDPSTGRDAFAVTMRKIRE